MLTRVRIEVEEETAEKVVESLTKYEHAIQLAEVARYGLWYTSEDETVHPWSDDVVARSFYNEQLGRDIVEEVIEFEEGLPGYRGRRVVRFNRLDGRAAGLPR